MEKFKEENEGHQRITQYWTKYRFGSTIYWSPHCSK